MGCFRLSSGSTASVGQRGHTTSHDVSAQRIDRRFCESWDGTEIKSGVWYVTIPPFELLSRAVDQVPEEAEGHNRSRLLMVRQRLAALPFQAAPGGRAYLNPRSSFRAIRKA